MKVVYFPDVVVSRVERRTSYFNSPSSTNINGSEPLSGTDWTSRKALGVEW